MNSHTDSRRDLIEFGNYNKDWVLCKVIIAKEDCVLGNHYHENKNECFMLIHGAGRIRLNNDSFKDMELYEEYFVHKTVIHEFILTKGSKLICLCDQEFDPKDEYKI